MWRYPKKLRHSQYPWDVLPWLRNNCVGLWAGIFSGWQTSSLHMWRALWSLTYLTSVTKMSVTNLDGSVSLQYSSRVMICTVFWWGVDLKTVLVTNRRMAEWFWRQFQRRTKRISNLLKSRGHYMYHQPQHYTKLTFCTHSVFMCFVWIWEQRAIISLYSINWLVCITEISISVVKTSQLVLCREIIAVCSQIHTKHINTQCGQNVEMLNVKLVVRIVTNGL